MEQVIIAGYGSTLDDTATEYNSISGGDLWDATEFNHTQLVSTSGKIKNLRVELVAAPGAGKSYAFTLLVNGAPSALTCTIADAATSNEDLVNEVDVVAGDYVSLECNPDGTPATGHARWTTMFEGSTASESLLLGSGGTSNAGIRYVPLAQSDFSAAIPEDNAYQVCPTSGKIKNLYIRLSTDPGTAPDAYRFTLRQDGISSALTVTITADNTTGNNVANEITVAAGELLTLMVEPLNSPSASPNFNFGMTFVADIDGESLILGGSANNLSAALTDFNQLVTGYYGQTWSATEAWRWQLGQACTLRKLYVWLIGAPGAGKSYVFTVRDSGADTLLAVTIADLATTGNNLVNTVALHDGDEGAIQSVPAGTPDVQQAHWGLVGYIAPAAPPAGLENKSAGMAAKMVGAGLI